MEQEHELVAGQDRTQSTARSTSVHDVYRHGPVDRAIDRGNGTVDRRGRPTERRNSQLVPVDRGQGSVDRPVDRQTRSVLLSGFRLIFCFGVESNQGFPKSLGLSGYKYCWPKGPSL